MIDEAIEFATQRTQVSSEKEQKDRISSIR